MKLPENLSEKLTEAKKWLLGTRNFAEAEEGIHKSQLAKHVVKTWAGRFGKVAVGLIALGVLSRAFVILGAGLAVGGGYLALKGVERLIDKNIEMKLQAEREMKAEADKNRPAPGLKPAAGPKVAATAHVSTSFNAATTPANDAAAPEAPRKSFLSRFGIGA